MRRTSRTLFALILAAILLSGRQPVLAGHRNELPSGTLLPVRFETTVSSATSRPEDRVIAVLREDVRVGSRVVLPEGSELHGVVVRAVPSGRVKTRARLAVSFDAIDVDGKNHPISTRTIDLTAAPTRGRDAGIVATIATNKGREVTLGSGTRWRVRLSEPLILND